jgi:light-harvesting complex 1 beta chain
MATQLDTSTSGLTESEAKEFHSLFVSGFVGFTIVAVVAHILVWSWRPWLPGVKGYGTSMIDNAHHILNTITALT